MGTWGWAYSKGRGWLLHFSGPSVGWVPLSPAGSTLTAAWIPCSRQLPSCGASAPSAPGPTSEEAEDGCPVGTHTYTLHIYTF